MYVFYVCVVCLCVFFECMYFLDGWGKSARLLYPAFWPWQRRRNVACCQPMWLGVKQWLSTEEGEIDDGKRGKEK